MNKATQDLITYQLKRIDQLKQIAPGLIKGAVEELYKTPFGLLGNMGKKKYKVLKKQVYNKMKKLKL